MVAIQVNEALAARLEALAQAEGQPIEAVLEELVALRTGQGMSKLPAERTIEEQQAAMRALAGIFDDDITDLSETVDQSVSAYLRKKHESAG